VTRKTDNNDYHHDNDDATMWEDDDDGIVRDNDHDGHWFNYNVTTIMVW
jgi:hypothetical protein